jgi:hypothetical protein
VGQGHGRWHILTAASRGQMGEQSVMGRTWAADL